uniref:Si:ch73-21k16.5 n=1 Tax=Cyprinus carpio TaxID=7962 RepID=A0A8C2CYT9_CYPCA
MIRGEEKSTCCSCMGHGATGMNTICLLFRDLSDGFFDILEERRRSSDLSHAFRTFNPQPYRGATPIAAAALNRMVLESQYLSYIIQEIMVECDEPREALLEEASALLDEMSQNLQLGFIRLLGFALSKVFKSVFSSIHVNEDGLTRVRVFLAELQNLMLPLAHPQPGPAIAIALMGMKLIGEIFRRSGAFFIRRAIGSDKLYWAVLSEYVRTIVRTGYAPLEFYVEGLRSRTLKSLTPKLGMMHMVLEPFFKGEVFDISLVPISISYERVLEESLLAHELLGVPKPKETTEALLKARTVLKEDYGCMHVCFGNPVSVRDLVKGKINRRQYNLVPRDLPMKPSKETQEFVSGLAHMIIRLQERNVVLSAWNLMAVVLLQNLQGIDLDLLTHKTLGLRRLALRFGAHLRWPKNVSDSEVMSSSVSLHHSVVRCERGRVYLVEEAGPGPVTQEEAVFRRAAAVLMCASYRNQAVHVFTRPAIVAVAMRTAARNRTDDVFHHFKFLLELFSNEFVLIPGQAVQDFEEGCSLLQQSGVIGRSDEEIYVRDNGQETIIFLREILQPFIESYQLVFRYLCEESSQTFREKMFSNSIRSFIVKLFISGVGHFWQYLRNDLVNYVTDECNRIMLLLKQMIFDLSSSFR